MSRCASLRQRLICTCVLLVTMATVLSCQGEKQGRVLSRKKRYLVFPEGSTVTMTMSNSQNLPVPILSAWASVIECDVGYKLPNSTRRPHMGRGRRPGPNYQHRRDRRELYRQLETLLDTQGLDGGACVKRAICEATSLLPSAEVSFIQDTMRLIFTIPPGNEDDPNSEVFQYEAAAAMPDCEPWSVACPFSLLHFHLPWD